jgi:hypothetical protein
VDEPREPLLSSVYRRRRVVATAGTAVGALLFVWAVGALLGGNQTPSVRGASHGVPLATTRAPASNPPSTGMIATHGSATSSPSASPSLQTTTNPTTTTTSAPPPGPPQACPDSVIRLTVTTPRPAYRVGQRPGLTLHITNVGQVPCFRDVSHQLRSVLLRTTSGVRLWSSADCYSLTTHEIPTLAPNQTLSYYVVWYGRTSAPGCPVRRETVPAGQYELVGQLGNLVGAPTPLTLG